MHDQTKSAFASRREAHRAATHASAPRQVWDIAQHAWKKVPR